METNIFILPQAEQERNCAKIIKVLKEEEIDVRGVEVVAGPTVSLYKLDLAESVKPSQVLDLQDVLAFELRSRGVRMLASGDGVGVEIANEQPGIVLLKDLLDSDELRNCGYELPVAIGLSVTGKVKVFDLAATPHLLLAGATQQGKSVAVKVIEASLRNSGKPVEFVSVDLKNPDVTLENVAETVNGLSREMQRRYCIPMGDRHNLPYVVAVVDEYGDLYDAGSSGNAIMDNICRLAQRGPAVRMHLILTTQCPSNRVINVKIKCNFPSRIAFRTSSAIDSYAILGQSGAERLIGRGDMLIHLAGDKDCERVQCACVS